ncbi:NAD(P)-binding domain-containing protein [uncultured Thioclava sp.]|uniref:NAD(P)-binding domain-containing protein n=1 Tax=uncultured Thioclava sp. TaxID=473858 RepID=UPI0025F5D1F5|nr:NAD(P)-binding domain-containing protein [uncultured Thioclava sp.]
MKLGFIGTGTIAAAIVTGLAPERHQITVSERSRTHAARLSQAFDCVSVAANQDVIDRSDIVFLGLLAAHAPAVLASLRFRKGQRVISFIAEMPLDEIATRVAPAKAAAIMLPFPAIAQGGSPILTLGDVALVREIFSPANHVFALQSVGELNAYLCAQAVLSPALLMIASTADWLERQGVERAQGESFLRALIGANLQAGPCRETLEALSTPGGYNLRLRQSLEQAGLEESLRQGLDALRK